MPNQHLSQPITSTRRTRQDRFIPQVTLEVFGQFTDRGIAMFLFLGEAFQDDPIQVASYRLQESGRRCLSEACDLFLILQTQACESADGCGRFLVAYTPPPFIEG